ncbi:MAG: hypothetical protein IPN69_22150 [Acidobacteria bacterium]|nr:hypothetical protein [Acidobacteriota bacterium]MBK8148311.1 hypothetical protein [Acidobacteriota bacterium]MBK8813410.1 hypothetical protein [Acidobacteriota bacterium]
MEETNNEIAAEKPVETSAPKQTWRQWLETDAAVRIVYLVFGFLVIALLMTRLQYSTEAICCGDWDGYYHIGWSQELWNSFKAGHWLPEFKWLPLTVLAPEHYADHHFLFHLMQIPFLWFFEPVTAAKIAAIFYSSIAIFSVFWLLYRYGVDYLLIWLLALLTCANPFFYRMNMAKAPPLTIIISVIGIYLLFERKYVWLMPLMFAFVWTYSLFPLLFIAAFIWTLIIGWNERRFEWRPLAYTTGGMLLGNLINPYFPQNIGLFFEHFWTKIKIGTDFAVPVGGEWYPYTGQELLTHFPIALAAMLIGYILFAPKKGKLPEKASFFLMFVTILLMSQFRSKRFAEYFPPFAILFAAFSWKEFRTPATAELPEDFRRDIEPFLDVAKPSEKEHKWETLKAVGLWTLGLVLGGVMFYNFIGVDFSTNERIQKTPWLSWLAGIKQIGLLSDIRGNEANDKYQRAMTWANENIPEGERIFNCNWDDFPKMFYFDRKHAYVYGLDPNYLYSKNPELYKDLTDITSGRTEEAGPVIVDKFGARYVMTDAKENEDMVAKLLDSGWADMVYEDDEARFLKIRDRKGEAPKEAVDDSPPTPEELKELEEMERNDAAANSNQPVNDEEEKP